MADFPNSKHSFTNFANGATSDAAQVTDIYAEVEAIEDGYLNGTARLNSSNSTHTNLSVTGGSTFTTRPVAPPPDMAMVFLQSTGAMGSSVFSTLSFLSQAFVTNSSMHSTTTNPDRITPQSTGIYQVSAQLRVISGPSTTSQIFVQVVDSSGNVIVEHAGLTSTLGAPALCMTCIGYKRFDVTGGYVQCRYVANVGGSTISLSSGVNGTWFSMAKL